MSKQALQKRQYAPNYLVNLQKPPIEMHTAYTAPRKLKKEYTYIKGEESHLVRRRMILKEHPEIATLLTNDQTYTYLVAIACISFNLLNCYLSKDMPLWFVLLNAYLISAIPNHTLYICVHDLTHHSSLFNKIMSVFCNIPTGVPSAMGFGRFHAEHHLFFSEREKDADLPFTSESDRSVKFKWYKYVFYFFIWGFYALRPLFMKDSAPKLQEKLNLAFIVCTNFLIYHYWGGYALIFIFFSGVNSIGAHPAAAHIIAEHYEFIHGLESYDYLGPWNFLNLNVGYHIEHHDFPTCPWYNLPKIRKMAPEYYEYLPHHDSYFQVLKNFLFDENYNLFYRTIRDPVQCPQ